MKNGLFWIAAIIVSVSADELPKRRLALEIVLVAMLLGFALSKLASRCSHSTIGLLSSTGFVVSLSLNFVSDLIWGHGANYAVLGIAFLLSWLAGKPSPPKEEKTGERHPFVWLLVAVLVSALGAYLGTHTN